MLYSLMINANASEALLLTENAFWYEGMPIVVANCRPEYKGRGKVLVVAETQKKLLERLEPEVPLEISDWAYVGGNNRHYYPPAIHAGYKDFKSKQKNKANIYSLAKSAKGTWVHRSDVHTLKTMDAYHFPEMSTDGYLVTYDIKTTDDIKTKDWCTILIAALNNKEKNEATLLFFDVSDPEKPLTPIKILQGEKDLSLKYLTKPERVRLKDGYWYFVLAGQTTENQAAIILLRAFDFNLSFRFITDPNASIIRTIPIDQTQQGSVDRIYAVSDNAKLWLIDLTKDQAKPLKLGFFEGSAYTKSAKTFPIVVQKDPSGFGLKLYLAAQNDHLQSAVFSFSEQGKWDEVILNDIQNIYFRFGHMVLPPRQATRMPEVLVLQKERYQPQATTWLKELSEISHHQEIIASKLLWDPKQQKDILILMNAQCELQILSTKIHSDYRLSWRRVIR